MDTLPILTQGNSIQGVNTPQIEPPSYKPKRRAITSAVQAWNIYNSTLQSNNDRRTMNAAIIDAYGQKPPYSEIELKKTGQYMSNFSLGLMPNIVDRSYKRLSNTIQKLKYLVGSSLDPDDFTDAYNKSIFFRNVITKEIKRWPGS